MQFPDTATRIKMVFPAPPFTMAGPVEFDADCKPLKPHGHAQKRAGTKK